MVYKMTRYEMIVLEYNEEGWKRCIIDCPTRQDSQKEAYKYFAARLLMLNDTL
jgi:hypothetical protein